MMTKSLPRDRWLAAALPALCTFFIGWLFILKPAAETTTKLRQRVQSQGPVASRKAMVTRARTDQMTLEKTLVARRGTPAGEESVFDRNAAMQQVSVLCDANGLSLNKSEADPTAKLPPALKDATIALGNTSTPPQMWRLELTGSYPSVMKLLDGLQQARPLIVPLNLSMQAGKTDRRPANWVLTLWL